MEVLNSVSIILLILMLLVILFSWNNNSPKKKVLKVLLAFMLVVVNVVLGMLGKTTSWVLAVVWTIAMVLNLLSLIYDDK